MTIETERSQTAPIAWNWLKTISRELYALDEVPLIGSVPSFPWDKLSEELAKAVSIEGLKISPGDLSWKEKEDILAAIAKPMLCTQIAATGIDGTCAFWICHEDVEHFMAKVLQISPVVSELQSTDLVTNFHRFLGIETVCLLNQLNKDPRISYKITSHAEQPLERALCQDINIQLGNEQMHCRLVISNEFRHSWRTFFLKPLKGASAKAKLEEVQTTVHLEAGRTNLTLAELLQIRPGDFVLLDHVFYDEDPEKSRLLLTLNGKPLFRARLKAGSLKILEIPLLSEVYDTMVEKINPPTSPSNVEPIQPPTPPPEHEDENPFADEEDEEDLELVETGASLPPTAQAPKAAAPPKAAPVLTPTSEQLTPTDIPIQLVVEVGAVTMSVQKLLELAPGNLIDLNMSEDSGVNLVVNGRIVGKGELLKIGESIGVRILQIGV